jgi:autotransporter family porin
MTGTTAPPTTVPTTTTGGGTPARFGLLAPGAALPSGAQCATWVRSTAAPAENKRVNSAYNQRSGTAIPGATGLTARVDGEFTGSTEQILRWAACKWGLDEDTVKAQVAVESWWRQTAQGDWSTDAAVCPPGHGLGVDGRAGQCPESWGLTQVRWAYHQNAWAQSVASSAFNVDYAYSVMRSCYVGELTWLNTVDRGATYAPGDFDGCLGVWFSGRWRTQPALDYITKVKGYQQSRIWATADFQEP